jgi:hypothetical protein
VADVRFGSKADILEFQRDVRFTPKSGHRLGALGSHQELAITSRLRRKQNHFSGTMGTG